MLRSDECPPGDETLSMPESAVDTLIPAWEDGRLQPVDKLAVHQRGLRHRAVSVFVLRGHKLLIQQRAAQKYHTPGLWANTCCTHPHWDEAPADCARRRLKEELGITGLDLQPRGQIEYRADVGGGMIEHEVVDLFLARPDHAPRIAPVPAEVAQVAWVDLTTLQDRIAAEPDQFTPWLRIYMAQHLPLILG